MTAFQLRLPDDVMEQARSAAAEEKTSVDRLLVALIEEGLGSRRGLRMLKDRAARGDVGAALTILDRTPDSDPDPGDELSNAYDERSRS